MDPATIFSIVTGSFQLAQQINQFKNRILAKSNDPKELRTLQKEAKVYIQRLQECENKVGEDAKLASIELRTVLEDIVKEIDALKKRKTVTKILTSLRIYFPEFEKRMVTALHSFHHKLSFESQKYSEVLLDSMTEQMKQLHITKTQLEALSAEQNVMSQDVKATMALVDCRMGKIEANMEHIKSLQLQMQEILRSLLNEETSGKDSSTTNESTCRVSAEILPSSDSITWFGNEETDPKPSLRIWCLDDPTSNVPSAEINGVAVSASASTETIDTIFDKRYAADEFDQNLSRLKRCRKNDVEPYVGIARKGEYLYTLRRFLPRALAEQLIATVPRDALPLILDMVRKLEQEYAYTLLDRISKGDRLSSLANLSIVEDMERANLALQADKMRINVGMVIRIEDTVSEMQVSVSRYEFFRTN